MTPDKRTEKITKLEFLLIAARQPLPVEQLRKEIDCSLEEAHELLVEVGKRRTIRFEFVRGDLAAVIVDVFTSAQNKNT